MPQTRKPCPACGEAKGWRDSNGICEDCKRLIEDGKTYRDLMAKKIAAKNKYELRIVPSETISYCWPRPYVAVYVAKEECEKIRDTFAVIALLFKEDLARSSGKHYSNVPALINQQRNDHDRCFKALFPKGTPVKLQELFDSIETALKATYKAGIQEGSNILRQLAEGKITVEKFNELTTESGVKG